MADHTTQRRWWWRFFSTSSFWATHRTLDDKVAHWWPGYFTGAIDGFAIGIPAGAAFWIFFVWLTGGTCQ